MATRRDVALKAKVSAATVTNVFNQSKYVSPEIRKKVFDAAEEVGYTQKQMMEFVFLCDDPSNPHNIDIFEGMCKSASEQNALVSMIPFSNDFDFVCDQLISKHISGVFISNAYHKISEEACKRLENNNIVVSSSWHDFQVDVLSAPMLLVDFLVSLGHEKICYLTNKPLTSVENATGYKNFKEAINKNNLKFSKEMIIPGTFPFKADLVNGYSSMKNALLENRDFTSVVAVNDLMAIGAMKAMTEFGLSIPKDISVVSCDDISFSKFCTPSLTTIHLPARSLGETCLSNMILKKMGEENTVSHAIINIIVRDSAAPPSGG